MRSCIITAAGSRPSRPTVGGRCTVVATLPSAHTIHPNRRSPTACAHQRGRAAAIIAAQPRWAAVAASTSQLEARTAGNCRVRGKWAADGSVRGRSSSIYGRYRVAADVQTGRAPHKLALARSNPFAAFPAPRALLRSTLACRKPLLASWSARGELVSLRPAGLDTASTRYGHQQPHTMRPGRYRGQPGHTCLNRHYCPPATANATLWVQYWQPGEDFGAGFSGAWPPGGTEVYTFCC